MSRVVSWVAGTGSLPAAAGPAARRLPAALLERWVRALDAWDAPRAARRSLERLADPAVPVVVTGQQPGPWGGPVYSTYKTATAVAAAERLGGVPVFWMGADDTDVDEVAWGAVPRDDGSLLRHRWSPDVDARSWLGDLVLDDPPEAAALLDGVATWWGSGRENEDLGDRFAGGLTRRFGAHGLLVLDARWAEVRSAGEDLFARYLENHEAITRALRKAGGVEPAIDPEAAAHGLFLLDDHRRAEPGPGWLEEARARLRKDGAAALAPSVVLRAPLQDVILAPAAQVVGRGEASYLHQLTAVYRALEVPEPARTPRLHATAVPAGLVDPADLRAAVRDPETYVRSRAAAADESGAAGRLETLRSELSHRIGEVARTDDRSFAELADSARRKIDHQLKRLAEHAERRARRALYEAEPRLRHLPELLRPRRGEQDRGLSSLALFRLAGEAADDRVLDLARLHLDRLAAGEMHHFAWGGTVIDVLAVGPHPDDVELAAGGTVARFTAAGRVVRLLDLTRGEAATRGTPEERAREAADAARALGVAGRDCSGLPDGGISAADPDHVNAVVRALRAVRPRLVITLHGDDDHPDHREGAELVRRAAYRAGLRAGLADGESPHRPAQVWFAMGRRPFIPSLVVPVDAVYHTKRAALACYRSQFTRDEGDPRTTPISDPEFLPFVEARDRVHGRSVGAVFGEPFLVEGPVPVGDPAAFLEALP